MRKYIIPPGKKVPVKPRAATPEAPIKELITDDAGISQKAAAAIMCCSTATVGRYLKSGKLRKYGSFTRAKASAASVAEFLGNGATAAAVYREVQLRGHHV